MTLNLYRIPSFPPENSFNPVLETFGTSSEPFFLPSVTLFPPVEQGREIEIFNFYMEKVHQQVEQLLQEVEKVVQRVD